MSIKSVAIVDDDSNARSSYTDLIEDGNWKHFEVTKLPGNVDDEVQIIKKSADAILSDYHLSKQAYSNFNGDVLVAKAYQHHMPALLCTSYKDYPLTISRFHRRWIPIILDVNELNPDSISKAFEQCSLELSGKFSKEREPWRTLVRIEEVNLDDNFAYIVIPGWSSTSKLRVYLDDFPALLRPSIAEDMRFHAFVNLGAEDSRDIYSEWKPE